MSWSSSDASYKLPITISYHCNTVTSGSDWILLVFLFVVHLLTILTRLRIDVTLLSTQGYIIRNTDGKETCLFSSHSDATHRQSRS